jgi:hypothetical protein
MIEDDDDYDPRPPDAVRVAARALVLAAVCCRALIERDAHKPGCEEMRQRILPWLEEVGAISEAEPEELELVSAHFGTVDDKTIRDASWRSEGMVVLAWALGATDLPGVHEPCEPSSVANGLGFFGERDLAALHRPRLRDFTEIENWADSYLTLHWRLRQFSLARERVDLVRYVSTCNWAALSLEHLQIRDKDLAIDGVRIDQAEYKIFRQSLSIAQERHQAFNWLLGFEPVYSQVTTDT